MSNSVVVSGYVGNMEVKPVGEHKKATFSLAVRNPGKKKGDEGETQWLHCEAWRRAADTLESYVGKGSYLVVEGKLKTDTWEKDGEKRSRTYIDVSDVDLGPKVAKSDSGSSATVTTKAESAPAEDELPPF